MKKLISVIMLIIFLPAQFAFAGESCIRAQSAGETSVAASIGSSLPQGAAAKSTYYGIAKVVHDIFDGMPGAEIVKIGRKTRGIRVLSEYANIRLTDTLKLEIIYDKRAETVEASAYKVEGPSDVWLVLNVTVTLGEIKNLKGSVAKPVLAALANMVRSEVWKKEGLVSERGAIRELSLKVMAVGREVMRMSVAKTAGVNARSTGEAEQAAQELLAWAEWELSGNTEPNPYAPPVWGKNLTPEVYRIIQPYASPLEGDLPLHITMEDVRNHYETQEYIDKKGIIIIEAIFNKAGIEYDDFMKKFIAVASKKTKEFVTQEAELAENVNDRDVARLDKMYNAGMEMMEDVVAYERRNNLDIHVSLSPIKNTLIYVQYILTKKGFFKQYSFRMDNVTAVYCLKSGLLSTAVKILSVVPMSDSEIMGFVQFAISPAVQRIVTLQEDIDGYKAGEEMTFAQACCHVAWGLKDKGVWEEFEKEVKRRGGEIEVDELTDGGITFKITLPEAPEVRAQEAEVNAAGVRARGEAL